MSTTARVVSRRKGGLMPEPGETVVDCSRDSGSPLGNPYPARYEKDLDTCIQKFERVFWSDMARRGIMWRAVRDLAVRVASGERIAMRCWCAPKRCHLDTVCAEVNKMADAIRKTNNACQPRRAC